MDSGKIHAKEMKSWVSFLREGMGFHWSSPLQGTFTPLLEGYQSGMESGDTESACLRPLENLEHELLTCVNVFDQLISLNGIISQKEPLKPDHDDEAIICV